MSRSKVLALTLLFSSLFVVTGQSHAQGCEPQWAQDQFCFPGIDGTAYASCVYDDGTGEALYVGGEFDIAGCQAGLNNIVKWDGHTWSPLTGSTGTGIDGTVRALAVYDDGTGPALYVGGEFTTAGGLIVNHIVKWDGSDWSALIGASGTGVAIGSSNLKGVYALAPYNDGTGSSLYVGGNFISAGGFPASNIAKWSGSEWSALGDAGSEGTNGGVRTLTSFNDGSDIMLYVGGIFLTAGGITVNHVATWDGTTWAGVTDGNGVGVSSGVYAFTVYDDGTGPVLVLGGGFQKAGSITAQKIATWNGMNWATLNGTGALFQPFDSTRSAIFAITVLQNDTGVSELYAGGHFHRVDGTKQRSVLRWDGADWSFLDETNSRDLGGTVYTLCTTSIMGFDGVYAAGSYLSTLNVAFTTSTVSVWDGSSWFGLYDGAGQTGLNRLSDELSVYDDGHESSLIVAGSFLSAGTNAVSGIARLSESGFSSPPGDDGRELFGYSIDVLPEGEGAGLYVLGYLDEDYGGIGTSIYRYDGAIWSAAVSDADLLLRNMGSASRIITYDDGIGTSVYIYGRCSSSLPGCDWDYLIAKWDGQAWVPLVNVNGISFNGTINAVTFFDDGTGPVLYAGGNFTQVGGVPTNYIARWNGTDWQAVLDSNGQGIDGGVTCLGVVDDGTGPVLLTGGWFTTAGGSPASRLAKWDGSEWSPLVDESGRDVNSTVNTIYIDEASPSGPVVYVGGYFTAIGDMTVNHVAKWDGQWSALSGPNGTGVDGPVFDLEVFDDGNGPALYVAGDFTTAGGDVSAYIAKYDLCASPVCLPDTNNDGTLSPADFGAWIAAFNAQSPACDQNADGSCTPADFSAWISNYNAGCG